MIVVWRIAYLMRLGRTCPSLEATLFFEPDEIHGTHLLMNQRRRPKRYGPCVARPFDARCV
ncbi:MAG: IS4 family transposase [Burkholderia sp.]